MTTPIIARDLTKEAPHSPRELDPQIRVTLLDSRQTTPNTRLIPRG